MSQEQFVLSDWVDRLSDCLRDLVSYERSLENELLLLRHQGERVLGLPGAHYDSNDIVRERVSGYRFFDPRDPYINPEYRQNVSQRLTILVAAGSNPERLRSEAAFAPLCGVNPIPASSGKTNRHRLNRGGHRQANAALHRIVIVRLRHDPRTQAYMHRRTMEGMSKTEIIRCLKRYVAREVYSVLKTSDQPGQKTT